MQELTIKEKIVAVLLSDVTSYQIAKETGVSEVSIKEMRKGKRKIENMTVVKAQLLLDYYNELSKKGKLPSLKEVTESEYM